MLLDLKDIHDPGPDPYTVFEAQDLHQHVLNAINDLPPQTQQATLLFYYQHMSLKEVAALLGVSVGTVKQQLHRARERLKERLRPLYHEYFAKPKRSQQMITLQIAAVIHSPDAKDQVILTDESGQHNLPLPIDPTSAQALMLAVSGNSTVSTGVPITADPEIIQSLAQTSDPLASSQPAISLSLPDDSIKGKIVGKNGRNIITFEILTGVKLIINATPQVVHIVSTDPQKREIAKRALSNLISSDRINPERIAETVTNAQNTSNDPKQSTDVQLFFTLPNTRPSPAVVPVSNDLSLERIVDEETITPDLITEIVSVCKAQHYLQT